MATTVMRTRHNITLYIVLYRLYCIPAILPTRTSIHFCSLWGTPHAPLKLSRTTHHEAVFSSHYFLSL